MNRFVFKKGLCYPRHTQRLTYPKYLSYLSPKYLSYPINSHNKDLRPSISEMETTYNKKVIFPYYDQDVLYISRYSEVVSSNIKMQEKFKYYAIFVNCMQQRSQL